MNDHDDMRDRWGDEVMHSTLSGAFLQLPEIVPHEQALREVGAHAAVYGIPWDATAVSRSGAAYGPRAIRDASRQLLPFNARLGFDAIATAHLVDCGNSRIVPANALRTFDAAQADLSQILAAKALPLMLGGDHSVTIPAVRAVMEHYSRPGLVLIDTHLDTAPDLAGEQLNHACPIARAVDAGFPPERMALVGINGWMTPPRELDYARDHGMTIIWIEEIWEHGVDAAIERALAIAGSTSDGLYLSVDVDSMDVAFAPGTGNPTIAGLTSREVLQLVRGIAANGLAGFDVVETAPSLDPTPEGQQTALLAARLALEALAFHCGARLPTGQHIASEQSPSARTRRS